MATITGTSNSDFITGTSLADIINGLGGSDSLYGYAGDDFLDGGSGNDYLAGGGDNDVLIGGSGYNDYSGGAGNDTFKMSSREGGAAFSDDLIYDMTDGDKVDLSAWGVSDFSQVLAIMGYNYFGAALDAYFNGVHHVLSFLDVAISQFEPTDFIYSTGGGGTQTGTSLQDVLFGSAGDDTLDGRGARDKLLGGLGNDILNGGGGNDDLIGGAGTDTMNGGGGYDWFVFNAASETAVGVTRDVIVDFIPNLDLIDLHGIDAKEGKGGDQAFTWIGETATFSAPGQLRYDHVGGNTIIYGNTDADAAAEFEIQLIGNLTLHSGDFFL